MKARNLVIVVSAAAVLVPFAVLSACADTISAGYDPPEKGPGPSFTEPDAGPPPEPEVRMCNAYDCPAPYATCDDKPGKCNTNLNTDFSNCGACGYSCFFEDAGRLPNGNVSCIQGKCHVYCGDNLGNCNGKFEDGCEAALDVDPENCGACGNACQPGQVCFRGACGCPAGYTQCGIACTKLESDRSNCAACGNQCEVPEPGEPNGDAGIWPCDAGVLPPNYGPICSKSTCKIGCADGYGDCNSDHCGDGCETFLANDPKNCGACGHACLPGQGCIQGECQCTDPNLKYCNGACVDLLTNPYSCGACGNRCPGLDGYNLQEGRPACVLGRCSYACAAGRADCDQRIDNGCETDTYSDPRNCGGCGVECDLDGGQPCIEGQCLRKPCDVSDSGPVF